MVEATHPPRRDILQTVSGRRINFSRPKPETFTLQDIAHHLSQICRFSGATPSFYSVATHSVVVSRIVRALGGNAVAQLQGLLHDSTESFISDIVSPVKQKIRGYSAIERRFQRAIYTRFGLPIKNSPLVKVADDMALELERGFMWGARMPLQTWKLGAQIYADAIVDSACSAKALFLNHAMALIGEIANGR